MPSFSSNINMTIIGTEQVYTLLSAVGPEKITSTIKPQDPVPAWRATTNSGSGSFAKNLQMNSKQAKSKKPVSLPVTCHVQHDLEGRCYTRSELAMSSWPVLCSNPDCREQRCKETPKDSYHWELDWESVDLARTISLSP
jgi:hypothetical protein